MAITIADEITRIKTNISNAYTACENKGATLPETQNSANLATTIDSISGGSSPTLVEKEITENGTYNAGDDNVDGYSTVTVNVAGGGTKAIYYDENNDFLIFRADYLNDLFGYSLGEKFTEDITLQNSGGSANKQYTARTFDGSRDYININFYAGQSSPIYIYLDYNERCIKSVSDSPLFIELATISISGDWSTGLKVDSLTVVFPEEWRDEQLY